MRCRGRPERLFNQVAWIAFAVLIVTGIWNVAAVSSEISRSASDRDTLIVKLWSEHLRYHRGAARAGAQRRRPRRFWRTDRRQRPGRVVPRRPAGRLSQMLRLLHWGR
jgi:hypothetical protein